MNALRHSSPVRARLIVLVFACAMLVRAIVPAGWMPVADAHAFRIVPCSGTGPVPRATRPAAHAMPHAMAGMRHDDEDHGSTGVDHPCAFAGVTPAIDAPALVLAAPIGRPAIAPVAMPPRVAIGHGLAAPPPPPTGPPAFV